jgi:hypothetical protein
MTLPNGVERERSHAATSQLSVQVRWAILGTILGINRIISILRPISDSEPEVSCTCRAGPSEAYL